MIPANKVIVCELIYDLMLHLNCSVQLGVTKKQKKKIYEQSTNIQNMCIFGLELEHTFLSVCDTELVYSNNV